VIKHLGDGQSIVQIENQKKFLLLPVEEASPEAKLYMIADNDVVRNMNVRLAINKVLQAIFPAGSMATSTQCSPIQIVSSPMPVI